ncbi:MAG: NAD(P)/FAD-dependent oxidoreductase [Euryarchaeota archaeon]|nr:NAD(P)/FAD-dependent oxidoreductase [Euryarchaeota archaeon]
MEQYDVMVVGAGPVGCFVASEIAKEQYKVALIEEHTHIGLPVQCAGLITPRVFETFKIPSQNIVQNEIYGANIHSPSGDVLGVGGDKLHAFAIDRTQFDAKLASLAMNAGVSLFSGTRVISAKKTDHTIVLDAKQSNNQIQLAGNIVVGADGPHSFIRKAFNLPEPKEMLKGIGAEITDANLDSRIPLGAPKKTVSDHVILVGDAAAQVKPTSGGGIYTGLLSARFCARVAIEALQQKSFTEKTLSQYHKKWTDEIGKELQLGMRFRKIFTHLQDKDMDAYIKKLNNEETIEIINSYGEIDYPSHLVMPLVKKKPSLLKLISHYRKQR